MQRKDAKQSFIPMMMMMTVIMDISSNNTGIHLGRLELTECRRPLAGSRKCVGGQQPRRYYKLVAKVGLI